MRKLIIILIGCTAVLLAGYVGYRGYKVWKQQHLMTMARDFIAKSDGKNAVLCVQEVLRANPQNLDACRMMAGMLDAARSPAALLWRGRVVQLNPKSTDDRLALAQTAMMQRDYASATNALDGVDAAGQQTAAYHNLAGAVAIAVNQPDQAEAHFLEAARLEPLNPVPQLNLAIVRLHGSNEPAMIPARATLTLLSDNPTNSALRSQALRELVADAMRHNQNATALSLSLRLLTETNSPFADRLLRLEVLQKTQSPQFNASLMSFQADASTNLAKIYELANWQMANLGPAQALVWLRSLPLNTQTNQPVALLIAESLGAQSDWRGLASTIQRQNWGELELIRHAFMARALRGQNLADSSKAEWDQALKAANDQRASLVMLLRLASQWNWRSEGEDILWTIVNHYPGEKWANQALVQALFVGGRTRSLMSLYGQQLKSSPSDLGLKNNLAMTAMLLDAQEMKPFDLAREVYQQASANPAFASTYAFSLHLQKKDADALKVMQQLKPQDLNDPSIAGYYALILKATGNAAQAGPYFTAAAKARLLPEEQKLFDKAKAGS